MFNRAHTFCKVIRKQGKVLEGCREPDRSRRRLALEEIQQPDA
jgi:hypothetical protein